MSPGAPAADVEVHGRPPHPTRGARTARRPRGAAPEHPRARLAARLAYVAVILFATLAELDLDGSLRFAGWRLYRALNPPLRAVDVVDAVRNVVLFAGLGAVWVVTARALRVWPAVWRATFVGVSLSVAVECVQLFSRARFASVLDVVTNGLGAFFGALVLAAVTRIAAGATLRPSLLPPPAFLVAIPYLAATLLEAFSPLGRTDRVPGAAGGPVDRLRTAIAYAQAYPAERAPLSDLLLVAPAGALAVLLLVELGAAPLAGAGIVAMVGGALFLVAELARGASGGDVRTIAVGMHVLAVSVGALVGALLVERERRADDAGDGRGARPSLGALTVAGYVAALACWSWRPFWLRTSLDAITSVGSEQLVPLQTLVQSFSLHSVADVGVGFLIYVPVGAWLAARPLRERGPLASLLPGLYLATFTEVTQLLLDARTFDVTDVLVQCAGVCVGWIVLRRADRLAVAMGGRS